MPYKKVNKIYVVLGLKRSGQHAIIEWIKKSLNKDVVYYNNIKPLNNNIHYSASNYMVNDTKYNPFDYSTGDMLRKGGYELETMPQSPNSIIISYEDYLFNKKWFEQIKTNIYNMFEKPSLDSFNYLIPIVIIRDYFNNVSSRELAKKTIGINSIIKDFDKVWSLYADQAINNTNFNSITFFYDYWLLSDKYRKDISKTLKLDKYINTTENLSKCAPLSSFNTDIDEKGGEESKNYYKKNKIKFFDRWKHCPKHLLKNGLKNKHVVDFTNQIFSERRIKEINNYLKKGEKQNDN